MVCLGVTPGTVEAEWGSAFMQMQRGFVVGGILLILLGSDHGEMVESEGDPSAVNSEEGAIVMVGESFDRVDEYGASVASSGEVEDAASGVGNGISVAGGVHEHASSL